ncbi:type 1 glutamine amidotransferase-like domain-containing protein [bacterium]|nr:type 1 glutamine amidotransferase-like domain-containing protein [bacterium]
MKLLLTSEGLKNKTIEKAFWKLVDRSPKATTIAYIPTAVHAARTPDKRWLINTLTKLSDLKIGTVDIVDISAIPEDMWLPKLKKADVIYTEGGNPYFLNYWFNKSGLSKKIKSLLKTRVYVGASAGSMVLGEKLLTRPYIKYSIKAPKKANINGLKLVKFSIRPHYNRADRSEFTDESLTKLSKKHKTSIYGIDDESAILIKDKKIKIISEGSYKIYG